VLPNLSLIAGLDLEAFFDLFFNSLGVKVSTTGETSELFRCFFPNKNFFFGGGGNKHTSKPKRGEGFHTCGGASPELNLPLVIPPPQNIRERQVKWQQTEQH